MNKFQRWGYRLAVPPAVAALSAAALFLAGGVEARNATPREAEVMHATQQPVAVQMRDFSYSPNQLSATAGQQLTVNVTNAGATPHTFTIQGVTDSGSVAAGQSRSVQFTPSAAGTLTFFCTIHGQAVMSGTIAVAAGAAQQQAPQQQQQPQTAPAQPPATQQQAPAQPPRSVTQPPSTGDAGLLALQTQP